MKLRISLLGLFLLVAVLVTACGGVAAAPEAVASESEMEKDESADGMAGDESADTKSEAVVQEAAMEKDESTDAAAKDESDDKMNEGVSEATMDKGESEAMSDVPAWFGAELVDVSSGQDFTIADFKGKVVLVETMAIWCSNCLRQQNEVKALHETLGERDDLVTVVLDIDANENAGNLQAYAAKHGFTWTYAVAPREVAREIGQLYGDQFLNPPSTPMLIIDRQGEVHPLPFGRKSADSLQEALNPFLSEGM